MICTPWFITTTHFVDLQELRSRIAAVSMEEIVVAVLKDEIENAESLLQPHDTGHLHDYISRLNARLEELDPYSG